MHFTLTNDLRFPRHCRLTSKADFKDVFDNALKVNQKHMLILCKPNQLTHSRMGVIVGKRHVNSAVERNRIRRIVKNSFRLHQEKLTGWDIVVIARQYCDTLTNEHLRKGIDHLWEKFLAQSQKC